jgi:glycosyltransferase involved in cell wall biosynthesis
MRPLLLHLSHTEIPRDSRILKELAALADLPDVQVVGVGVRGRDEGSQSASNPEIEIVTLTLLSKRLTFLPRPMRYAANLVELIWKMLAQGRRYRPTVVHCHDTMVLPIGWLFSKLWGTLLVYDAHELESDRNGQSVLLSWFTLKIEQFCWSQVNLLVTVSNSIIQWYKEHLGAKPAVLVLNSPIIESPTSLVPVHENYFHNQFGIPVQAPVFIYVGIIGRGRGIHLILDAFADPTMTAHVVFLGFGEMEDEVRRFAKKFPNIHYHPSVPHAQVVSHVRQADVGLCLIERVSLSDYLCLPNKLFEYTMAGLPVLGSDFPEIAGYLNRYAAGSTCPLTVEGIREGVRRHVDNPQDRLDVDLSEVAWPAQADRLRTAYERLMSSPRS